VSLLQAEGLRFDRSGRVIFEGVSFSVRPGDRVAVTGPSGSGKTSLLSVLAGLAAPTAGTVRRDGEPVAAGTLPDRTAAVLQGYGLVSLLTATENVEIMLRAGGVPAREAMAVAGTALAGLGLGDYGDHLVQELSGGQQQRVAVARALATGRNCSSPTSRPPSRMRSRANSCWPGCSASRRTAALSCWPRMIPTSSRAATTWSASPITCPRAPPQASPAVTSFPENSERMST
jgi:ABC-type transport system involved in cytochrome c biogenesis ATPase subunit